MLRSRRAGYARVDQDGIYDRAQRLGRRYVGAKVAIGTALVCLVVLLYASFDYEVAQTRWHGVVPVPVADLCPRRYPNGTLGMPAGKYYFALNLHESENVVGPIIAQLERLMSALGPDRMFVSIYESGSLDTTAQWLRVLQRILSARRIPHALKSDMNSRGKQQHRIDFLATVRNIVMEPLYNGEFAADFVVFINDVVRVDAYSACEPVYANDVFQFFCADDVARLAQRIALGDQVEMVCAMDFVATPDSKMLFYDIWVTRDMAGQEVSGFYPYFQRSSDIERLKAGLPIPVYSCWNGLTVISADVFARGIRFRSGTDGMCMASECFLFCKDVWDSGPGNILIDPAVTVFYEEFVFSRMLGYPLRGLAETSVPVIGTFPVHEPKPKTFICAPMVNLDREAWMTPSYWHPTGREPFRWEFGAEILPELIGRS